jgi:hypothetical protein
VQAAHSCEEYVWRLYESFPPARFVSSLISSDLQRGFLIANQTRLDRAACRPAGRKTRRSISVD